MLFFSWFILCKIVVDAFFYKLDESDASFNPGEEEEKDIREEYTVIFIYWKQNIHP